MRYDCDIFQKGEVEWYCAAHEDYVDSNTEPLHCNSYYELTDDDLYSYYACHPAD